MQAAKLELVEGIRYNSGMASSLCSYHVLNGSWKAILQDLEQVLISEQQLHCCSISRFPFHTALFD